MLAVTRATMMPYRQVMTGQTDFATIRKRESRSTKTLKQGDSANIQWCSTTFCWVGDRSRFCVAGICKNYIWENILEALKKLHAALDYYLGRPYDYHCAPGDIVPSWSMTLTATRSASNSGNGSRCAISTGNRLKS